MKQNAVNSIIDSWQDFEPSLKLPKPPPVYGVICGGRNNHIASGYGVICGGSSNSAKINVGISYRGVGKVPDPNTIQR